MKAAAYTGIKEDDKLLEVVEVGKPVPKAHEILIKAAAFASNPTDWKHLYSDSGPKGTIAGSDVSGVVEQVGSDVQGYKAGDYVSGFLHGNVDTANGGFAEYVALNPITSIKYASLDTKPLSPGDHPIGKVDNFESAASVTLGLVTVALSFSTHIRIPQDKAANSNDFILIWGGATATGFLAIQMAKLVYGLKVIATASSKHSQVLKSVGADYVVDYHDADAVDQIRKIGAGHIKYGLDTVSNETTFQALYDSTYTENGDVVLDNLLFLNESNLKTDNRKGSVRYCGTLAYTATGENIKAFGGEFQLSQEEFSTYSKFWNDTLPPYLPQFKHAALKVLPAGLTSANEAIKLLKQNQVSGEKVVFHV